MKCQTAAKANRKERTRKRKKKLQATNIECNPPPRQLMVNRCKNVAEHKNSYIFRKQTKPVWEEVWGTGKEKGKEDISSQSLLAA